MKIDLHTHSTISDGSLTPIELVKEAKNEEIDLIALCDHDTVGDERFLDAAKKTGVNAISGIEVSADFSKGTCHILGLGLKGDCSKLKSALWEVVKSREERNGRIIEKLNRANVDISLAEVEKEAFGADVIGRPHMAKVMVERGFVKSIQEAFDTYLKKGAIGYVERFKMDPEKSIELLISAGAKPVIAHPTQLKRDFSELDILFGKWKNAGLWGIEVYTPYTPDDQIARYIDLAKKYDLKITGGSDFHGSNKKGHHLGQLKNGIEIDTSLPNIVSVDELAEF